MVFMIILNQPQHAHTALRGHDYKLYKRKAQKLNIRKNFFTLGITDSWNKLPHEVVNVVSLNAFKAR